MSKSVLAEQIWLGGASAKEKFFVNALAIVPHVIYEQLRRGRCAKLKYVHVNCPEHKQVAASARKSEILVQNTFSIEEKK
jgi:hypothetical protein